MLTTQQAKLKQLKRVQLLKSQTQQNAETMDKQQRKDAFEESRAYEAQARIHKQRAERLAREAEVEVGPPQMNLLTCCTGFSRCCLHCPPFLCYLQHRTSRVDSRR